LAAGARRVVVAFLPAAFVVGLVAVCLAAGFRAVVVDADVDAPAVFAAAGFAAGLVAGFFDVEEPADRRAAGFAAGFRGVFAAAGVEDAAGDADPAPAAAVVAVEPELDAGRVAALRVVRRVVAVLRVAGRPGFAREADVLAAVVRRRVVCLVVEVDLLGVTAPAASAAAAATPFAAPPIASPTLLAADAADDVAIEAILPASEATSDAAASACRRRFAIALARGCWAAASCRSRLDSVLRAASSRFSSLWSSLVAACGSGVTAPFASTTTPETVSMTLSVRLFFRPDPSPRLAIDRPPVWRRIGRDGPSPSESLPRSHGWLRSSLASTVNGPLTDHERLVHTSAAGCRHQEGIASSKERRP
jgi:hypothetical protein